METKEVMYLCSRTPTAKIKIGKVTYQAVGGVLRLPPDVADVADELMKTRHDIRHIFKKVDITAAEDQVKKHRAAAMPTAVQGPFGSDNRASAVMRANKNDQETQTLTGSDNPVNIVADKNPPIQMEELKTAPEIGKGLLDRFKNKK